MNATTQVFAYRNLHRKLWSLRATRGADRGRIVARETTVLLENCTLKVSEAGRQRVIAQGRKNVHAGIVGTPCTLAVDDARLQGRRMVRLRYNPRVGPTFTREDTGETVITADLIVLDFAGRAWAAVPR